MVMRQWANIVLFMAMVSCSREMAVPGPVIPPAQDTGCVYVTGVEFPAGYDWTSWLQDGKPRSRSLVFLMKDGERILEVLTDSVMCSSSMPGRHRCIGGHLYMDFPDGDGTVVMKDGTELFRYDGHERLSSFKVDGSGHIWTLGAQDEGDGDAGGGLSLRRDGFPVFSCDSADIVTGLHTDSGDSLSFSYRKAGRTFLWSSGEQHGLSFMQPVDSVLAAVMYRGSPVCVVRLADGGGYAVSSGKGFSLLETYKYDCLGNCRFLFGEDSLFVYGELNYQYDRLRSPQVWRLDGRIKAGAGKYKQSFFTFVSGNDVFAFIGNQEYSPYIKSYVNGTQLYSYGSGLDVTADPAAVIHDGRLYFLFCRRHGQKKPYLAVDSESTEYGFNGYFTGISVW